MVSRSIRKILEDSCEIHIQKQLLSDLDDRSFDVLVVREKFVANKQSVVG